MWGLLNFNIGLISYINFIFLRFKMTKKSKERLDLQTILVHIVWLFLFKTLQIHQSGICCDVKQCCTGESAQILWPNYP